MSPRRIVFNEELAQDQVWTTSSGEVLRLRDMGTDHLLNVAGFLLARRHLVKTQAHIKRFWPMWVYPADEGSTWLNDMEEARFEALDPVKYLHSTPFWGALRAEIKRRGEKVPKVADDAASEARKAQVATAKIALVRFKAQMGSAEAERRNAVEVARHNARLCEHGVRNDQWCDWCSEPDVPSGGPD